MPEAAIPNVREHVLSLAKRQPAAAALVDCDERGGAKREITYGELPERLEAAARYLRSLGLAKGDKVALAFRNCGDLLVLSWAAWSSGIVTVPLDVKRDTEELGAYKIKLNKAKALIVQKGALPPMHLGVPVVEFTALPALSGAGVEWERSLAHPALILFTSGTTAHPKGAQLSFENLIVNAESIREWLRITSEDRFLVQLPLHHINSTTFCLSTVLAGGAVLIPPQYSNSRFWEQAARSRATITSIVQSILADQLERTSEYEAVKDQITLNRIQIGSAPVVAHSAQEFIRRFCIPLYQGYGQTETALRVSGVPMGLPQELYERLVEENSIGAPMPWADLQIADKDGKLLGEGEEGELVVQGKAVMQGYVGGEEAFRNGYFLTGDIGLYKTIDGRLYFFLKGRSREIIIKGGINISPVAVENGLKKISPDIAQAYCVGYPDDRYGEEVAAAVVWREGVDEQTAERTLKFTLLSGVDTLSAYETPRYLASIRSNELPLTSTGKVQRTVLRKNLPPERFSSIYELWQTPRYRFVALSPHSPLVGASRELYNHCWQPLSLDSERYTKDIAKQIIVMALDSAGKLAGQIAIIRTNLSADELLQTKYADLITRVADPRGTAFVCISICSADFKPKAIPPVDRVPAEEEVRAYLALGHDAVARFHAKPKGGLAEGARLVGLIPAGRPEDKSACGYNMLLKYPAPEAVSITKDAPVSNQLIEAALLLAQDIGSKDVYAYSRPGGLAAYIARKSD